MEVETAKVMKDVACVVFNLIVDETTGYAIYLIDVTRHKLIGYLKLNYHEYPHQMAFVVYKSMLYFFGGYVNPNPGVDEDKDLADAYALDLFELAKAGNEKKPVPTKLTPMKCEKGAPAAVVVGHLICVFNPYFGGSKLGKFQFEVYDTNLKSWDSIDAPLNVKPGSIDADFVKDNKLYLAIRNNDGIQVVDFGSFDTPPIWTSIRIRNSYTFGRERMARGAKFGFLVVTMNDVYDFGEKYFGCPINDVDCTGKTANERYHVAEALNGGVIRLGPDKVCTVTPQLVKKPYHWKPNIAKFMIAHRKPLLLRKGIVFKKRRDKRKGRYNFLVNVCSFDINARPINMEVVESFTVPMYFDDDDDAGEGILLMLSLCDP